MTRRSPRICSSSALLAAYGSFLVADLAHTSGIIASVIAGIVVGTLGRREGLSSRASETIDDVWEFLAFVLTGAAFLAIGVAIPLDTLFMAVGPIAWGVAAVLLGRALVVYGLLGGVSRLGQRLRRGRWLPLGWLHVMNWTGLRGAVAVALALSIPQDTPDRAQLQGIVFGIVLFTLVAQGSTIEPLMRRAGVRAEESEPSPTEPV